MMVEGNSDAVLSEHSLLSLEQYLDMQRATGTRPGFGS